MGLSHSFVEDLGAADLTGALKAIASEAWLAPTPVGSLGVQTHGVVTAPPDARVTLIKVWNGQSHIYTHVQMAHEYLALILSTSRLNLTYAVVFACHKFQVVAILALAQVAAEGVDALSVEGTQVLASDTFINICSGDRETEEVRFGWLY